MIYAKDKVMADIKAIPPPVKKMNKVHVYIFIFLAVKMGLQYKYLSSVGDVHN